MKNILFVGHGGSDEAAPEHSGAGAVPDRSRLEQGLRQLPLMDYWDIDPEQLEFSRRVRRICEDCPRYGRSWSCPPAVGTVEQCRERCLSYGRCLLICTAWEPEPGGGWQEGQRLHEEVTRQVGALFREQGVEPYVLSSQSCDLCRPCLCTVGRPCPHPAQMPRCLEGHGINLMACLAQLGVESTPADPVIRWYSMLFYAPAHGGRIGLLRNSCD